MHPNKTRGKPSFLSAENERAADFFLFLIAEVCSKCNLTFQPPFHSVSLPIFPDFLPRPAGSDVFLLLCRARAIRFRQDSNEAVGGFFSQIGQLYMVHHLWGKFLFFSAFFLLFFLSLTQPSHFAQEETFLQKAKEMSYKLGFNFFSFPNFFLIF